VLCCAVLCCAVHHWQHVVQPVIAVTCKQGMGMAHACVPAEACCCLQYELVEAVKKGDAGKVQRCLAAGVSANCKDIGVGIP
jgi:hypothetical protein